MTSQSSRRPYKVWSDAELDQMTESYATGNLPELAAVSYTHLDVYKRQRVPRAASLAAQTPWVRISYLTALAACRAAGRSLIT